MRLWDRNLKENTKRYKIIRYLLQEILTKFKKGMNILLITTKLFQHTYLVNLLPKRGNKNNYFDRKKTACQDKQFQDILGGIIFSPNFEDSLKKSPLFLGCLEDFRRCGRSMQLHFRKVPIFYNRNYNGMLLLYMVCGSPFSHEQISTAYCHVLLF